MKDLIEKVKVFLSGLLPNKAEKKRPVIIKKIEPGAAKKKKVVKKTVVHIKLKGKGRK